MPSPRWRRPNTQPAPFKMAPITLKATFLPSQDGANISPCYFPLQDGLRLTVGFFHPPKMVAGTLCTTFDLSKMAPASPTYRVYFNRHFRLRRLQAFEACGSPSVLVRFALGHSGARMDRRKKPLDVTASSVSAGTVILRGSEFSSPPRGKNLDLLSSLGRSRTGLPANRNPNLACLSWGPGPTFLLGSPLERTPGPGFPPSIRT